MTTLSPGAFLGIAISTLALLGSLIGTMSVIFSAAGKGERAYLAMGYLVLWLLAFGFLALCFFLPSPWTHVALVAFFVIIPAGAFRITMKSQIIRKAETLKKP